MVIYIIANKTYIVTNWQYSLKFVWTPTNDVNILLYMNENIKNILCNEREYQMCVY